MKVYTLRAFAADRSGGNPAGVVLDAETLNDDEKKLIAARVGFSETAFVEKSHGADFKVRFFTPTEEVDLCGHATIATYALLFEKGIISPGSYTQELKAGILGVTVTKDGFVFMEQALPKFSEILNSETIQGIFNQTFIFEALKPQIVSTGLRDVMFPVESRKILFSLDPDLDILSQYNRETDSIGLHAFTFDTIYADSVAHCRNFSPLYGIREESATGSSSGALACYLFKNGFLNDTKLEMMRFEQGYSMQQPSEIFITLVTDGPRIFKILVGGHATFIGERDIG